MNAQQPLAWLRKPTSRLLRSPLARVGVALALLALAGLVAQARTPAIADDPSGFTNFETEPVRPLAMAPDGQRLFAVNTADDFLEIFDITPSGLTRVGEVAVGLRPVAVAARTAGEVWVSNHLSDSVSVVDVSDPAAARVIRTLTVGDEPRDIVVAGPNRDRVFVATARRAEPDLPGAPRAEVWIFDAGQLDAAPEVLPLFGMKPRALAVSADGATVYAAIFHSGNRTTVVDEEAVLAGGGLPPPNPENSSGVEAPNTSLIVRYDGQSWLDETSRDWSAAIPFTLPDQDVFAIDAVASPPRVKAAYSGAGTVLFNMAVQPGTGDIWVTNTEARNHVRFEPNLRGHATESRVTRISPGPTDALTIVQPLHLNPHIIYRVSPGPPSEIALTLGQPTAIEFSADGRRAYVAAFGSGKVGVLDSTGRVLQRIAVGFGPGGLALDEARARLYVLNHLDASLSIVDLAAGTAIQTIPLHFDPTPAVVKTGRPFLYDMTRTGGHGDMACVTCHVFGDFDQIAWDLGDPAGAELRMPFKLGHDNFMFKPRNFRIHPMKGPMTTQSFRGLLNAGPMHWRADRFGPTDDPTNELESFSQFMPAFKGLNGMAEDLPRADMDAFAQFLFTVRYPPNPMQNLDRSRTAEQQAGADMFLGPSKIDSGIDNCAACHTMPLGTGKKINFEGSRTAQDFKAPHLRNVYQKVGRFDIAGDQVTGFGFAHDGSSDTLVDFLKSDVFDFPGDTEEAKDARRKESAAFVLAFDTGMAPAVGRQITAGAVVPQADRDLLDLLVTRAAAGDCDLVARGRAGGDGARGWLLIDGAFRPDRQAEASVALGDLLAAATAPGGEITFTCVPPGDGVRNALDRDRDGALNGDERAAGSDPADPASRPGAIPTLTPRTPTVTPTATPTTGTPTTPSATPTRLPLPYSAHLPWLAKSVER
jgi:YVTN family beta-propeller protein